MGFRQSLRQTRPQIGVEANLSLDPVTTGDYHDVVKSVGVKQLKSRLSEYLRLVRSGEIVLVTDRDEVVAELRPARRQLARPIRTA